MKKYLLIGLVTLTAFFVAAQFGLQKSESASSAEQMPVGLKDEMSMLSAQPEPAPSLDRPLTESLDNPQSGPTSTSGKPVIYFGIDDGPSCSDNVTWGMLDLFKDYGAHATWFVTGYGVNCDPDAMRAVVADGHAIGNHTYNHEDLTLLTDAERLDTFSDLQALVTAEGGPKMTCYRPPYGATNDSVRASAAKLGMIEWLWNVDPRDWDDPGVDAIVDTFNTLEDGDVVVIHDGNSNQQTLDALEIWLPANVDEFDFMPLPGCAVVEQPVYCNGLVATIVGTSEADTLIGTTGNDVIWGGDGGDTIKGYGGDDVICGGGGMDDIWGGNGNDKIYGQNHRDTIYGGLDNDSLYGGEGIDTIFGGGDIDKIWGGSGSDKIYGGAHRDTIYGGAGGDIIRGGDGIDSIRGGLGEDTIYGDAGWDLLWGDKGNDTIFGGLGRDELTGGPDSDSCNGGDGTDTAISCESTTLVP